MRSFLILWYVRVSRATTARANASLVSFLGVNDGENSFTQAGNNYVGQRQAFLLGSKIDTELGFPSPVPFSDPSIQILVYLRDVRAKAKWLQ